MTSKINLFLCLVFFVGTSFSQVLNVTTYRDLGIPHIETDVSKYNFGYPLCSNGLDSLDFSPPNDGVFFKATYGHRYLSSTSAKTDNHGGFDYWDTLDCDSISYSSSSEAPIICMCDGYITEVFHGTNAAMELTAKGRSVQVTCDSLSQALTGAMKINYRHLSALGNKALLAHTAPTGTIAISKGDTIGIMGESGYTSNVHLHLSVEANHPQYGNQNVHTARIFDPTLHPGVLEPLTEAKIELLHDWPDSALFRIIWPFNQTINRFEFSLPSSSFSAVFDKEEAYGVGSSTRDDFDCIAGFQVYAYQFNGKQTAKSRYNGEKGNMPAIYPASPQRDLNQAVYKYLHIPINHDSVAYVYDFVVENLPPSHSKTDFNVKLSDVWGYIVEGSLLTTNIEVANTSSNVVSLNPNPTNGIVNIQFKDPKKRIINIINQQGQVIVSQESMAAQESLNIESYASGVYFVKIISSGSTEVLKIVKK
jgi:hypothetical protein